MTFSVLKSCAGHHDAAIKITGSLKATLTVVTTAADVNVLLGNTN